MDVTGIRGITKTGMMIFITTALPARTETEEITLTGIKGATEIGIAGTRGTTGTGIRICRTGIPIIPPISFQKNIGLFLGHMLGLGPAVTNAPMSESQRIFATG